LSCVAAVADGNETTLRAAYRQLLEAHQSYFTAADRRSDWNGFICFEAVAISILARSNGIDLTKSEISEYVPPHFSTGAAGKLPDLRYKFPPMRIILDQEPRWFLDLSNFPRATRSHQIVDDGEHLLACYQMNGAPGMPPSIADFLLPENPKLPQTHGTTPALALDAGQLLLLAEDFASRTEPASTAPRFRAEAIDCIDAVLARIPIDAESVPIGTIASDEGRRLFTAEPGRFRQDRLKAYRDGLLKSPAAGSPEKSTVPDSRDTALFFLEIIRAKVLPLLEELRRDATGQIAQGLKPLAADYEKVFLGDAIPAARAYYEPLWSQNKPFRTPAAHESQLHVALAPAGMLLSDNELSHKFPSGYHPIAPWLHPHKVWAAWKYTAPGATSGMSYDGLVWCDDHWAWFPKPYRALQSWLAAQPAGN